MRIAKDALVMPTPQLYHVKDCVDRAFNMLVKQQAFLTSNADGKHSNGSLHYEWLAWDFRVWIDYDDSSKGRHSVAVCKKIATVLRRLLGDMYDVVVHIAKDAKGVEWVSHIHVEYDPK